MSPNANENNNLCLPFYYKDDFCSQELQNIASSIYNVLFTMIMLIKVFDLIVVTFY